MRIKNIKSVVSAVLLMASLTGLKAASTVLTAWDFDQLPEGATNTPGPTTGIGTASALGMANFYNGTTNNSTPDIEYLPGSSNGTTNGWQIVGTGIAAGPADAGWSTAAPIGSQGAQFNASTFGYYRVMLSFDVNAAANSEANLQVQYTTDPSGTNWWNATNITVSGGATLVNNANGFNGTNGTVAGSYVALASGWNNQITVDLSGISGVDNNPNFAIRLVNASTGTNCVDTTGAVYANTTGTWAFNNVSISGVSIDTIADWTFTSYAPGGQYASQGGYVENPIPEINVGQGASAACIGFNTSYNFAGTIGSTNAPDVTQQSGSSTPNNQNCWRLRGAPGNGWYNLAPIGSQGAEFDVNTVNFSNVVVTMDVYFTSQGEARMCVLYTTNGWTTTNVANNLYYPADPAYILTNDPTSVSYDPDIVGGTYFYETGGQNFYNNWVLDFTGYPNVAGNPNFGIRVVNAATGNDVVASNGGSYNDNSGNCRLANVVFGGHFEGSAPPALTAQANATVDNPFTNTFTDDPTWRASISAIYVNGNLLTNGAAFNTNVAGKLIFNPVFDSALQVNAIDFISIYAKNYSVANVSQAVQAGKFKSLTITTQPLGPSASGGTLTMNPALSLVDQYGNTTTNPFANVTVTAGNGTNSGANSKWILGGATNQTEVDGVIQFTNLTATLTTAATVGSATIALTINNFTNVATTGTTTTNILTSFAIGTGPVPFTPGNIAIMQIDTVTNAVANNDTFSIIEIKPNTVGQSAPVNIVPVSATGSNALREATSGTTGRLALSDDGTLLCFAAFADANAFTPDETLNLSRAAASMNCSNQLTIGATYVSTSLGGSQARAAVTVDDINYYVDDKGGLYYGNGFLPVDNIDDDNNVVVKSFGQTPYVETQKVPQGAYLPVVYTIGGGNTPVPNNLTTHPNASDFYLVSTNCGQTFDIMYVCDQNSASQGVINKYSYVAQNTWANSGTWTNSTSIDGMFAATNGSGGVYIYYTTGNGGVAGNSVVRLTDASTWNQNINITASNVLYTTTKNITLKGLTFVPQLLGNTNYLMPAPLILAQSAMTNTTFNLALVTDDSEWRNNINAIYVNGSLVPNGDYSTATPGQITFSGTMTSLLQSEGNVTITISATGYSTNSTSLELYGTAAKLVVSTAATAPKADGAALAKQPVVTVEDSGGNVVTSAGNVTAVANQATWTLLGNGTVAANAGVATYSGLSAFSAVPGTNIVTIKYTSAGVSATNAAFTIPAAIYSVMHEANVGSGKFSINFTNATGLSYLVLGTNSLQAPNGALNPVSTWPVLGAAIENPAGSGTYTFTNSVGVNTQFYYILEQQP